MAELPPSPGGCSSCNPSLFTMNRMETWKTAHRMLTDITWEDESVGPADVLLLAMFLEGVVDD